MKKAIKLLVVISVLGAAGLVVLGAILFVIGMSTLGWNFRRLDPNYGQEPIVATLIDDTAAMRTVNIQSSNFSLVVAQSTGSYVAITYYDGMDLVRTDTLSDSGEALTIALSRDRDIQNWFHDSAVWFRGISANTVRITVPTYIDVSINGESGSIWAYRLNLDSLYITNRSGNIRLTESNLNRLNITNQSGSVIVQTVSATRYAIVNNRSGRISLTNLTSDTITIDGQSGAIRADLLTAQSVSLANRSGAIVATVNADTIRFDNTSGRVRLTVHGAQADFDIDILVTSGSGSLQHQADTGRTIVGRVASGSSRVTFV